LRHKAISPLLIFILLTGSISGAAAENVSRYLYTSTFKLENRGETSYTLTELETTILLFMNNRWQTVSIRNSTHSIAYETFDVDGNRMAELDLPPTLPPGSEMTFSVVYEIEALDQPKPEIDPSEADPFSAIPSDLVEEFSVETETYNARDEAIYAMALKLTENETTVLGAVSRLIEWITVNVAYGNFEVPRYPEDTIFDGAGDCDDQSILLITLCRTLSIPAFLQVGLIFGDSLEGDVDSWGGHLRITQKGVGWHGWAMIYIPPWGWLPVDLTIRRSHEGLAVIREAPEYGSHIIKSFNVSRQEYIGDSIISRNQLMRSELYVTAYYVGVKEDTSSPTRAQNYIVMAVGSVVAVILVFLFIRQRRVASGQRY
jgi:transglutaminase-like putative cysteine protease